MSICIIGILVLFFWNIDRTMNRITIAAFMMAVAYVASNPSTGNIEDRSTRKVTIEKDVKTKGKYLVLVYYHESLFGIFFLNRFIETKYYVNIYLTVKNNLKERKASLKQKNLSILPFTWP